MPSWLASSRDAGSRSPAAKRPLRIPSRSCRNSAFVAPLLWSASRNRSTTGTSSSCSTLHVRATWSGKLMCVWTLHQTIRFRTVTVVHRNYLTHLSTHIAEHGTSAVERDLLQLARYARRHCMAVDAAGVMVDRAS